ncbi:MAG: serine/threonine protein kinase [Acidobacteria bacterium]|nr:serine/threonine protein kinase [Acidobacteriota bacterium]
MKLLSIGRLSKLNAERFREERQILARLEHPHIARLFDGGTAEDGSPFLAMELVRGERSDAWCARQPLRDRLVLFEKICGAVEYAHRNLVLHRDIKSANILVNPEGEPKLLDFGIARPLEQIEGNATQTGLRAFTPDYASPEQIEGKPTGTATDVYSLGVVLHEWTTGRKAFSLSGKPLSEVIDAVCRYGMPAAGTGSVELDAIIAKAVRIDPAERYHSVADLAADIRRYLEGRPVGARPATRRYRFRRLVSRNRLASAMAAALFVVIAIGAASYVRQSRTQARRFEDARKLIRTVVFDVQPKMEAIPATLPLRKTLIEETMTYLQSVSRDTGGDVTLMRELAGAYRQLSRILGDANYVNLGDRKGRDTAMRRAEELLAEALAQSPSDAGLLREAAEFHGEIVGLHVQDNFWAEARRHAAVSLDFGRRAAALAPADLRIREALARSYFWNGVANRRSDWKLAVDQLQKAYTISGELGPSSDAKLARYRDVIGRYLSAIYNENGVPGKAVEHARTSFALASRALEKDKSNQVAQFDFTLAALVLGEALSGPAPREAAEVLSRAAGILDAILLNDPGSGRAQERLAEVAGDMAVALRNAGEVRKAFQQARRSRDLYEALAARGQLPAGAGQELAQSLSLLAELESDRGNPGAACAENRRALELFDAAARQSEFGTMRKNQIEEIRAKVRACP